MTYTYIHKFKDTGQVFYIGMSKNLSRMTSKQRNHQPLWHEAVANREWFAEMVATWATREEAESHEQLLIECFTDLGHPLVNLTKGGAGRNGFKWTAQEHEKQLVNQIARGKMGGKSTSEAKQIAARRNGALASKGKRLGI